jgi:membrane associated rhomboid family serine protease
LRFFALAGVSAIAAAALHLAAHPYSAAPLIGASGAGAGLMGACVRFIFAPPEPWPTRDGMVLRQPALGFRSLVVDPRVLLFVGVWLASNFLFAVGAGPMGVTDANVAWEAHVGGFAAGLFLFSLFDPRSGSGART